MPKFLRLFMRDHELGVVVPQGKIHRTASSTISKISFLCFMKLHQGTQSLHNILREKYQIFISNNVQISQGHIATLYTLSVYNISAYLPCLNISCRFPPKIRRKVEKVHRFYQGLMCQRKMLSCWYCWTEYKDLYYKSLAEEQNITAKKHSLIMGIMMP